MKINRINSLDSLRGIFAVFVSLYHLNIRNHISSQFINNSWIFVDFFFVLSGFVISLNYLDRIIRLKDILDFQIRRFLRLYPLHFLMTILFLFMEFVKYTLTSLFNLTFTAEAFSINSFGALVSNLFLLQGFTDSFLSYNYPSWTISIEFFTYAFFAITVFLSKRFNGNIFNLLIFFEIIAGFLLHHFGFGESPISGTLRCIYSFIIGILIFKIYIFLNQKFIIKSSIPSFVILLINIIIINYVSRTSEYLLLIPFSFALLILSLALTDIKAKINSFLNNNFLVYLGSISYGIYMTHAIIWVIIRNFLIFYFKVPRELNNYGYYEITMNNLYLADLVTFVGLIAVILFSHLSYQFIEKRFFLRKL